MISSAVIKATGGLLLSAYAFSVIGDRLATAALVCFIIAALLLIVGVFMFVTSGLQSASNRLMRQVMTVQSHGVRPEWVHASPGDSCSHPTRFRGV